MKKPDAAQEAFEEIAGPLCAAGQAERSQMFGARCVCIPGGKYFAMAYKGKLLLKLPGERVAELIARKRGRLFSPGGGRIMKGWIAFDPEQPHWRALVEESRAYAQSLGPRTAKTRRAARARRARPGR